MAVAAERWAKRVRRLERSGLSVRGLNYESLRQRVKEAGASSRGSADVKGGEFVELK